MNQENICTYACQSDAMATPSCAAKINWDLTRSPFDDPDEDHMDSNLLKLTNGGNSSSSIGEQKAARCSLGGSLTTMRVSSPAACSYGREVERRFGAALKVSGICESRHEISRRKEGLSELSDG